MSYFHFTNLSQIEEELELKELRGVNVNDMDHLLTIELENDLTPEQVRENDSNYDLESFGCLEDMRLGGEVIEIYRNNSTPKWKRLADNIIPSVDLTYDYVLRYKDTGGDLPGSPIAPKFGTNKDPVAVGQYLSSYTKESSKTVE